MPWKQPEGISENPNAKYLTEIADYGKTACDRARAAANDALKNKKKILSHGGNHLRAVELPGIIKACDEEKIPLAMLWLDAHPDMNTPEGVEGISGKTRTGNMHGQVAALAQGHGAKELLALLDSQPELDPKNILFIGINAPDNAEIDLLKAKIGKENVITIADLDLKAGTLEQAISKMKKIRERLGEQCRWWTEFDVDVIDDKESLGKNMPNDSGMTKRELYSLFLWMGKNLNILGLGVSEVAPEKDRDGSMRNIVQGAVARLLLGMPNIPYSEHLMKEKITGENQTQAEPSQKKSPAKGVRRNLLGWIAAGTASVASLLGLGKYYLDQKKAGEPNPHDAVPGYVLPPDQSNDRQYAFTGISKTNRLLPISKKGPDIYSVETLQQLLKNYKDDEKGLREIYSCLFFAELREADRPLWQVLMKEIGPDRYWKLVDGYRNFISTVDRSEAQKYMNLWDRRA